VLFQSAGVPVDRRDAMQAKQVRSHDFPPDSKSPAPSHKLFPDEWIPTRTVSSQHTGHLSPVLTRTIFPLGALWFTCTPPQSPRSILTPAAIPSRFSRARRMATNEAEVDSAEFARILTKQVKIRVVCCTLNAPVIPLPFWPSSLPGERQKNVLGALCVSVCGSQRKRDEGLREGYRRILLVVGAKQQNYPGFLTATPLQGRCR